MRWSYRIFRVAGISVELHLTFILFLLLILGALGWNALMLFILLFTVVLAHELVHSFTAMMYNIKVPMIILTPIGGLASVDLPDDPVLELKVSIAGPMFNFMLAGVGLAFLYAMNPGAISMEGLLLGAFSGDFGASGPSYVMELFVSMNLLLGAFNMLPAFPMDGGRVFRSILALWVDYVTATRIATSVGQFIFLLLTVAGILGGNLMLAFIGILLSFAGGNELKYVRLKALLSDVRLKDVAAQGLSYVNESLTWGEFMSTVYRRGQSIYLVVDSEGVLRKVLDLGQMQSIDAARPVGQAAGIGYSVLDGQLMVAGALKTILSRNLILVSESGVLAGYVTPQILYDSAVYLSLIARLR